MKIAKRQFKRIILENDRREELISVIYDIMIDNSTGDQEEDFAAAKYEMELDGAATAGELRDIQLRDILQMRGPLTMEQKTMKLTKRQLRRIIKESLLSEILPGGTVPRSVQADYDIANKEDTFPKPRAPKEPKAPGTKSVYNQVNRELTRLLVTMPGYQSIMSGEGAYVDVNREEVVDQLAPLALRLGAQLEDGYADETFIRYPSGVTVTVFGSGAGTEIDFGPAPDA